MDKQKQKEFEAERDACYAEMKKMGLDLLDGAVCQRGLNIWFAARRHSCNEARELCEAIGNVFYSDDWDESVLEIKELAADLMNKMDKQNG